MSDLDLPEDECFVLCHWAVTALAEDLRIDQDEAMALVAAADEQDRVRIAGTRMFAGVMVDGQWVLVVGRARITEATRE
jgi:hypothetical protein